MTFVLQTAYWVIIPAAGTGQRMQADRPKQYLDILGKTILEHTLLAFNHPDVINGIVVSLAGDDPFWPVIKTGLSDLNVPLYEAKGGAERCQSVHNALQTLHKLASPEDWVLVHDAARPCVSWQDILRLVDILKDHEVGGLLASPVKDTIKRASDNGRVESTVDRHGLWRALTPQMFRYGVLQKALQQALDQDRQVTDDASAIEQLGLQPQLIEGSSDNIKITTPEDRQLAEYFLSRAARHKQGEP